MNTDSPESHSHTLSFARKLDKILLLKESIEGFVYLFDNYIISRWRRFWERKEGWDLDEKVQGRFADELRVSCWRFWESHVVLV